MGELLRNLAIQPNKGNRESEKNSQDDVVVIIGKNQ